MNNRIVKICDSLISWGIPFFYLTVSASFYLRTYDSCQIKITALQIIGAILLAVWLIKLIEEAKIPFQGKFWVVLPVLVSLLSAVISFAHSPFKDTSLDELIRRTIYTGIALIVFREFNEEKKIRRLVFWLTLTSAICGIYGLIQFLDGQVFSNVSGLGLDPFVWRGAFGGRIFSTFGNPNFFADFLVAISPLILVLFFMTRRKIYLALFLLNAFCLWRTVSKAGWIGFTAGFVAFVLLAIFYLVHAQQERIRRVLSGLAVGVALLCLIGVGYFLSKRIDSARFRVFTWISTWEMILKNPVIGTGLGTFKVVYPTYRRPEIFHIEGKHNTETDHPEDEYLEVWYDEGIIGFGVFLWMLLTFSWLGLKTLNRWSNLDREKAANRLIDKKERDWRLYLLVGLLACFWGLLVHNLMCVSLRFVSSGIYLWLFIGLIGVLTTQPVENELVLPISWRWKRGLQITVAGIAVYLCNIFSGYFLADYNHNLAIYFSKTQQWEPALQTYQKVISYNPGYMMAHYFMGNVYNDRWAKGDAERALAKYQDTKKLAPNYVQVHYQTGMVYFKLAEAARLRSQQMTSENKPEQTRKDWEEANGHYQKAMEYFQKYEKIDPVFPLNYARMGWIYLQWKDLDAAEKIYLAAIKNKPDFAQSYSELGNIYYLKNKWEEAEQMYKNALKYEPRSAFTLRNLAILYGKQDRLKEAREMWEKLLVVDPKDQQAQQIIKQFKW
ncbi:MAG: tetratricopeptide repeat protein [Elusimicrobiota bacterium]